MSLPIPDSTMVVTLTAVGFALVSNLLTRRFVDLEAERRIKVEVNEFTKAMRAAVKSGSKAEQEKLKKKEPSIQKMRMTMSSSRMKVSLYTIAPFFLIYYLMAIAMGGYGATVAFSPVYIPYLMTVGKDSVIEVSLFGWYLISSFAFSGLLTKLLKTQT